MSLYGRFLREVACGRTARGSRSIGNCHKFPTRRSAARDTYLRGRGRMLVKLLDLFTIEDGMGEEYDTGELVTYLNDAVMIAPSMLFVPDISFSPVDANSFDVSLTDHGRTVTARVIVDENGAPKDFSTTDRFCYDPKHPNKLVRARWSTPMEGSELV